MDMYFYYKSITDVSLYNCSAIPDEKIKEIEAIKRPLRGISAFVFGICLTITYILCLHAMLQPKMISKACYKIMFCLGLFDLINAIKCNVFISYSLTFGIAFCDAPNLYYIFGCLHMMCWTGASYFCLYLAFNRMIEILKLKRDTINFFFSPNRTILGCVLGLFYALYFFMFQTPMVYSNAEGTVLADPLNLSSIVVFYFRDDVVILNNLGIVVFTFFLYGIFCVILYRRFKKLPDLSGRNNHLHHQVFIQATLMCFFNFLFAFTYSLYIIFPLYTVLSTVVFMAYQYSLGLQALVYLFCNHSIRDEVNKNVASILRCKTVKGDTPSNKKVIQMKSRQAPCAPSVMVSHSTISANFQGVTC